MEGMQKGAQSAQKINAKLENEEVVNTRAFCAADKLDLEMRKNI